MTTQIVYIPGLGDHYAGFRSLALRAWRLWGVATTHTRLDWYDGGSMESKMALIQQAIDAVPQNRQIVLIGESAGASLALCTAAKDKRVNRVITLCGVASSRTPIAASLRRKAPALDQAVGHVGDAYRSDIQCVRAAVDTVVGNRYSVVPGAQEHVIWSIGHLATIVLCLTLLAPYMAYLAKKPIL